MSTQPTTPPVFHPVGSTDRSFERWLSIFDGVLAKFELNSRDFDAVDLEEAWDRGDHPRDAAQAFAASREDVDL